MDFMSSGSLLGERTRISKKSSVENKTRMGKMRDDFGH